MKLLFSGITLILLCLVGAVIAAPQYIDWQKNKHLLEEQIADAAGVPSATIEGPVSLKIFPQPHLDFEKLILAGHSGATPLAEIKGFHAQFSWAGFLQFGLLPQFIKIEKIAVNLVQIDENTTNYQPKRQARRLASAAPKSIYPLIGLGHTHIQEITVLTKNLKTEEETKATVLNLMLESENGLNQTNIHAQGFYNNQKDPIILKGVLDLSSLRKLALALKIRQSQNDFIAEGLLRNPFVTPTFDGLLSFQLRNKEALPKELIKKLPQTENLTTILEGRFSQEQVNLHKFTFEAAGTKDAVKQTLTGTISFEAAKGQTPLNLALKAQANNLNLDLILPTGEGSQKKSSKKTWSETPFDISFLKEALFELELQAQNTLFKGQPLSALTLKASNSLSHFRVQEASISDGAGYLKLDGSYAHALPTPQLSLEAVAKNLNIAVVLPPSVKKHFGGSLNLQTRLNAQGASEKALISTLSGQGKVEIKNGRLPGARLTNALTLFRQLFKGAPKEGKDGFSQAQFTFVMEDGTLNTKDLSVQAENFTITGQGKADFEKWAINTRLYPEIKTGFADASIPIHISGDLSAPTVVPIGTSGAAKGAAIGTFIGGPIGAGVGALIGGKITPKGKDKTPTTEATPTEQKPALPFDLENLVPEDVRNFLDGN